MNNRIKVEVNSEVGKLETVILHKPGPEVENMTPESAEQALYSDILNISVANQEYDQFFKILKKVSNVLIMSDLLEETLRDNAVKQDVISKVAQNNPYLQELLADKDSVALSRMLIEGVNKRRDTLTGYLSSQPFELQPLHNFFFMRDASSSVNNSVFINKMASEVRARESLIMETIFKHLATPDSCTHNPQTCSRCCTPDLKMEGGDILVADEDILLIGTGLRTSPQGIDYIARKFSEEGKKKHIIVQQLPQKPESFIHLDMVFTLLDRDKCMIYKPLILDGYNYKTLHLLVENGKITSIKEEKNILEALKKLGKSFESISCGGTERQNQEREQWHSGANFFAFAPGKIIGYARNVHTIEALHQSGFEVLKASDVIDKNINIDDYKRAVVTIEGAELARGGGGARCMTMPVLRQSL